MLRGFSNAMRRRTPQTMMTACQRDFRAAVVFHGSGVYDGTETTEAVSLLIGLSRLGADYQVFAPNRD